MRVTSPARACGAALVAALLGSACGATLMKLPSDPGSPAPDAAAALADATDACRAVTSLTAVAAVRGSVGGQRLRGNLETGLAAPASARLEAVAPFGQPLFIFVARGTDATLLLPRDDRVLEHGPPDAVLEAITGVPLGADDLRMALTGCATAPDGLAGRAVGAQWRIVPDGPGELYVQRDRTESPWRLVAVVRREPGRPAWRAEYRDFVDGLPQTIRLTSLDGNRFDLRLRLSQVEINAPLGPDVFEVRVPASAAPITLDELRRSGPLSTSESE